MPLQDRFENNMLDKKVNEEAHQTHSTYLQKGTLRSGSI